MQNNNIDRFHLISGLPRSGSTLLVALLRQNPNFTANVTSPILTMLRSIQTSLSGNNEAYHNYTEEVVRRTMVGAVNSYFDRREKNEVIFDTNRFWPSCMPLINAIANGSRVICCVRKPSEVFGSFERIFNENPLRVSKIFPANAQDSIFMRFDYLFSSDGVIGSSINALNEALSGKWKDNLLIIEYDDFVSNPELIMSSVYSFIGEPSFEHDFEEVEFSVDQLDIYLGTPGLHSVARVVQPLNREVIIPAALIKAADERICW